MKDLKATLLEGFKESLRVVLLAVVPVLVTSLEKNELDWRSVGIVAVLALLRGVDKWVHEWGKVVDSDNMTKGLTRF